jgi:hypothetical protein
MDGDDGSRHPRWAANLVWDLFKDMEMYKMCLCHSRHYARMSDLPVSLLYFADKLSFAYIPWWMYITLTRWSGELYEYKLLTHKAGQTNLLQSDREWHRRIRENMIGLSKSPDAASYLHNGGDQ